MELFKLLFYIPIISFAYYWLFIGNRNFEKIYLFLGEKLTDLKTAEKPNFGVGDYTGTQRKLFFLLFLGGLFWFALAYMTFILISEKIFFDTYYIEYGFTKGVLQAAFYGSILLTFYAVYNVISIWFKYNVFKGIISFKTKKPDKYKDTTFGSSEWATNEEIFEACGESYDSEGKLQLESGSGINIGAGFISTKKTINIVTVGNPGSGKNTSLVYPALLNEYWGNTSLVINDPKGANAELARPWLESLGFKVKIIKFDDYHKLGQGSRFNPLLMLDVTKPDFSKLSEVIAESLTPTEGSKDQHWDLMAREWLQVLIMHLTSYYSPAERTFLTLMDWLSSEKGLLAVLLEAQTNDLADGKISRRATSMVEKISRIADDGEARSILSNTRKALRNFDDNYISYAFSGSDFNWVDLANEKTAIFICLPADSGESHYRALRLLTLTAFHALRRRTDDRLRKVWFLLDEFAQMGKMTSFVKDIAELREYNVSMWLVLQNLAQIKSLYGQDWLTRHWLRYCQNCE
jgi:type IV secretory pathway TraG/TraD family ATPase VirD4